MKVIDLYKLIANKEYDKLPQKIILKGYDYIFSLREDCAGYKWYGEINTHDDFEETIHQNLEFILNCEITICEITILDKIEENKIPEKLDVLVEIMSSDKIDALTNEIGEIQIRFNQLIDYLQSKGE